MKWSKKALLFIGVLVIVVSMLAFLQGRNVSSKIASIQLEKVVENRLRFKVNVETHQPCDVYLKYWSDRPGDTLYSDVSRNSRTHKLAIVNLREKEQYKFQVVSQREDVVVKSKIHDLSTTAIYQATPFFTLDFIDSAYKEALDGKYFLTQKLDYPGAVIMIDHQGDIVWYESFQKGVRVSHWTKHNTVLCILGHDSIPFSGGDEIVEVAMSGEVVTHLKRGQGEMDKIVHHDVRFDEKDNIYALTFDWRMYDLRSVGGTQRDSILGDGIVVLDKHGKKLWEWSVFDHLDPLKDPAILKDRRDWVHANALIKDNDGDFLVSFRDLNQVWKVDAVTGEVKWKLGQNGDFDLPTQYYFSGQHSPHMTANGDILMLDNGVKTKRTRALSFQLDVKNKKASPSLEIALAQEYFSIPKGNATVFDANNYLLCLSQPRALMIVDRQGNIRWKVLMGGDPYRVEMVTGLNKKPVL